MTARQYGIDPQQLFAYLQENNQLSVLYADVRRGLALARAVEAASVTDTAGKTIDTKEFFGRSSAVAAGEADGAADGEADGEEADGEEADGEEADGEEE